MNMTEPMKRINPTSSMSSDLISSIHGGGPLIAALLSSLGVIVVSELGDKTFFIALIMSLSHPPCIVLTGAMIALTLMTVFSACLGLVSVFIPTEYVHYASVALFFLFGLKMFYDAYRMSSAAGREEYEEVQRNIDAKHTIKQLSLNGDPEEGGSKIGKKLKNLRRRRGFQLLWVCFESFLMTFVAEWGDRSQVTTIVLVAKQNAVGVVLGAVLGHFICTLLAVLGGKIVADRISLKAVTICGGIVFMGFAAWTLFAGPDTDVNNPDLNDPVEQNMTEKYILYS